MPHPSSQLFDAHLSVTGHGEGFVGRPVDRDFFEVFSERLLAVWNEHDASNLLEFVTPDVVFIDPELPEPVEGVDGMRAFMESTWQALPDLRFEDGPSCFAPDGPFVMTPWRMMGTHLGALDPPGYAPTGRTIDIDGVDVLAFRAERICRYRAHYDTAEMARQLGLLPEHGSRAERRGVRMQRVRARLSTPRR